jgi:class 3 adenylate cyclase
MDKCLLDPASLQLPSHVHPLEIMSSFVDWCENKDKKGVECLLQKPKVMHHYLQTVKKALCLRLGLPTPASGPDGSEIMYRESFIRWQGHFPTVFLNRMSRSEEILHEASASETIVVMGDIRRSQDLMTYARDSDSFISHMVTFIGNTRRLIDDNLGIFDKFTGDGFLAYFNKAVCAMQGLDYRQCFLSFVREESEFASGHFQGWCQIVRKLPEVPIGLCLGADLGQVFFRDISSYFMAVGNAIVWAKRMADAGVAGETIVNNLLYEELKEIPELRFEPRQGHTKVGELFLARALHT